MFKKLLKRKVVSNSIDIIENRKINSLNRSIYSNYLEVDNKIEASSCINCKEKYCYNFTIEEVDVKILDSLPYNNDLRVCPTNAIVVDEFSNINITDSCISCGLCVQRCPIGGIYLNNKDNYKATKYEINENVFEKTEKASGSSAIIREKIGIQLFTELMIEERHLDVFYSKIKNANTIIRDFELIITRNILIMLGVYNKVNAKGNNDSRFDLIGMLGCKYLLAEIDFKNNDNLSLIRKTLENISILENKYKLSKTDKIIPVIIINDLPSKRSDIYELFEDIYKITNIKIFTLPLHFLLICLLLNKQIQSKDIERFYINRSNNDFKEPIINIIKDLSKIDPYFKLENKYKILK